MGAEKWILPFIGSGVLAGVITVSSAAGGMVQKMDSVAQSMESIDDRFTRIEARMDEIKRDSAEQGAQNKIIDARLTELEKRK